MQEGLSLQSINNFRFFLDWACYVQTPDALHDAGNTRSRVAKWSRKTGEYLDESLEGEKEAIGSGPLDRQLLQGCLGDVVFVGAVLLDLTQHGLSAIRGIVGLCKLQMLPIPVSLQ